MTTFAAAPKYAMGGERTYPRHLGIVMTRREVEVPGLGLDGGFGFGSGFAELGDQGLVTV